MKIYTITAVLCLATTALATEGSRNNIEQGQQLARRAASPQGVQNEEYQLHRGHNEHGVEAHKDGNRHSKQDDGDGDEEGSKNGGQKGDGDKKAGGSEGKKTGEGKQGDNKKNGGQGKGADGKAPAGTGPGAGTDPKQGGHQGAAPANGKAPIAGTPANPANAPSAKKLADKTPVDISLMQGPPEELKEVAVLQKDADSSLNSFTWTVPTTVPPALDYSIRLKHEGQIDTYSHYFEIVAAGDPRSSKSNVGEPLEMPMIGDVPQPQSQPLDKQPLDKQPLDKLPKPNAPPNPPPANKPAAAAPPTAAKPVTHASAAVAGSQSANMLAFAMTLFGAVYLL
ncbi:hypothetical protein BG000_002120 [Podila horticola]|nr:hypothetical protein BG000_002120 [Podila horticola]